MIQIYSGMNLISGDILIPTFLSIVFPLVAIVTSSQPSIRVVYYLHTVSANWNEARLMCASYGGILVTFANNYNDTSRSIQYVDSTSWGGSLKSLLSSKDGVWTGLYKNSTSQIKWLGCKPNLLPTSLVDQTTTTTGADCYLWDKSSSFKGKSCTVRLPYICQRDDGQCWFQPYTDLIINDTNAVLNEISATDESECARLCRNSFESGKECWAFSYRGAGQTCFLHLSSDNHKYAISKASGDLKYFSPSPDFTVYIKICTGGWKSELTHPTADTVQVEDENCTTPAPEDWSSSVCYCECDQPPVILAAETLVLTIDEKVEQIQQELHVDSQNTSNTRRKKISAEDRRPSAQSIGYVGVAFLICVFGGIVLLDMNILLAHMSNLCNFVSKNNNKQSSS